MARGDWPDRTQTSEWTAVRRSPAPWPLVTRACSRPIARHVSWQIEKIKIREQQDSKNLNFQNFQIQSGDLLTFTKPTTGPVVRLALNSTQLARQARAVQATQRSQSAPLRRCWLDSDWPFASLNLPLRVGRSSDSLGRGLCCRRDSSYINLNLLRRFKFDKLVPAAAFFTFNAPSP